MNTEESPVYGYLKKPSMVDYPGCLSSVFFISGCNFACGFCHNASLLGKKQKGIPWDRLDAVCQKFHEDWVEGAVVSGGEPTLSTELPELIQFLKKFSFKIKLDTNGSNPEILKSVLPEIDYVAMDIKTGLSHYPELTGYSQTENVQESVRLLKASGLPHEFRTTVIQEVHTDEKMHEVGRLIEGAHQYVLQPFVPKEDLLGEQFREMRRTPDGRLKELEALMGMYVENVTLRA